MVSEAAGQTPPTETKNSENAITKDQVEPTTITLDDSQRKAQHPPKVIAVVVAWNRQELLAQTLDGLHSQTQPPQKVVVIDNASTDDSAEIAATHPLVPEVITMPHNLGGAGGFAAGIARAVNHHHADLVWIMDDDTVPTPTALETLLKTRTNYNGTPAVMASKAIWTDGREHPMNRPRPRPLLDEKQWRHAEQVGAIPIRTASFVSILIDARAIQEDGLPQADYFLWNDDFEYTARLLRHRVGLYVPTSIVEHKTKKFGDSAADPGPRFTNEVRNKVWTYTRSQSLNPVEKLLYGGKTLLRWAKTIAESENPQQLINYGVQGLKAARYAPRETTAILADSPVIDDTVAVEARQAPQTKKVETTPAPENFAVLMSVYAGDDAEHFLRALRSISRDQLLKPNQIVLVQDGPVSGELEAAIKNANEIAGQTVTVVKLEKNQGLARALMVGLRHCQPQIIARADADDISLPHRFHLQIPQMKNLDLLGAAIAEFTEDETQWQLIRRHPLTAAQIKQAITLRDPFNHPSVVLRRSAVHTAGGYQHCERLEDYWLFARMVAHGARCANLKQVLVAYRVGTGAYRRRGGKELWHAEIELQQKMRAAGLINQSQYWRNLVIRATYRLIPTPVRAAAYRSVGALTWFRRG